jgi:NAD(P)-dependent dehydrogenase (short-subunit alcohol dehydrogenase family)
MGTLEVPVTVQSALVTGASRGLGAALATLLAARGTRVAIVARDPAPLEAVAQAIRAGGGVAFAIPGDIADKYATHRIAMEAAALVGPVELLVHAASTLGPLPMPQLLDTACEDLDAVLQTNLVGPFRLTKAIAGSMALRRRGTVLHVSSDAAVTAYPAWGAYGASKAAQDQLSRVLASELADHGVRVLSVDPGEMDTQMHRDAMPGADPATLARPADAAGAILRWLDTSPPTGVRHVVASAA